MHCGHIDMYIMTVDWLWMLQDRPPLLLTSWHHQSHSPACCQSLLQTPPTWSSHRQAHQWAAGEGKKRVVSKPGNNAWSLTSERLRWQWMFFVVKLVAEKFMGFFATNLTTTRSLDRHHLVTTEATENTARSIDCLNYNIVILTIASYRSRSWHNKHTL